MFFFFVHVLSEVGAHHILPSFPVKIKRAKRTNPLCPRLIFRHVQHQQSILCISLRRPLESLGFDLRLAHHAMCTKKRSKHTPREIELPQGLQIIQAGESPLEYQDPERGSRSLTLAVVSGLDDAHVLKFPGDKVWPFSLQACAAAILVVSIVGAVKLFQSHINPSPIFFIVYGLAQIFVSPTFPELLLVV
jgi:hypothetical protein